VVKKPVVWGIGETEETTEVETSEAVIAGKVADKVEAVISTEVVVEEASINKNSYELTALSCEPSINK
jgi:hypothetical protein